MIGLGVELPLKWDMYCCILRLKKMSILNDLDKAVPQEYKFTKDGVLN